MCTIIANELNYELVDVPSPCSPSTPLQRISVEYEALLKDHEDVKKKLEASKARNKSLSMEMKSLKSQVTVLLDKGKHDDELVDALLVRDLIKEKIIVTSLCDYTPYLHLCNI